MLGWQTYGIIALCFILMCIGYVAGTCTCRELREGRKKRFYTDLEALKLAIFPAIFFFIGFWGMVKLLYMAISITPSDPFWDMAKASAILSLVTTILLVYGSKKNTRNKSS